LAGRRLGALALGLTRARAHHTLRRFTVTHFGFDDFCLRGWGIRVGYPSRKLLRLLPRRERSALAGRVVIALTANRYYKLDGVRPGTSLAAVRRRLKIGRPFHIGLNDWYIVPGRVANGVLKVRHGVAQEVGIADKRVTRDRKAQLSFLTSFSAA
jgi:hypothetical protein